MRACHIYNIISLIVYCNFHHCVTYYYYVCPSVCLSVCQCIETELDHMATQWSSERQNLLEQLRTSELASREQSEEYSRRMSSALYSWESERKDLTMRLRQAMDSSSTRSATNEEKVEISRYDLHISRLFSVPLILPCMLSY